MLREIIPFLWVAGALLGTGCGHENAPVLSKLTYLGQSEESPMVLLFAVDFTDQNGDLGSGSTEYFLDGQMTLAEGVENQSLFLANQLDFGATEGTINFVLELMVETNNASSTEEEFEFAVQMRDAEGYESNRESLRLQLSMAQE
ncbi:MAG: hypothetical protein CMH56_10215 [Myxococcales bacterium]|nr:hypothetical protein [Myxococcales bacterium]